MHISLSPPLVWVSGLNSISLAGLISARCSVRLALHFLKADRPAAFRVTTGPEKRSSETHQPHHWA